MRDWYCERIRENILPYTECQDATYDQLAEEMLELHLAIRKKHRDSQALELIEIASLALNMLASRPDGEVGMAFIEWDSRHGEKCDTNECR